MQPRGGDHRGARVLLVDTLGLIAHSQMSEILENENVIVVFEIGRDAERLGHDVESRGDIGVETRLAFEHFGGGEHAANRRVLGGDLADHRGRTRTAGVGDFDAADFAHEADTGSHEIAFDRRDTRRRIDRAGLTQSRREPFGCDLGR